MYQPGQNPQIPTGHAYGGIPPPPVPGGSQNFGDQQNYQNYAPRPQMPGPGSKNYCQ